jgi:effector-binding domain-containing protein
MLSPFEIIIVDGTTADPSSSSSSSSSSASLSPPPPPPPAAVIHFTIPRAEIGSVFGPAVEELIAALKAQNIAIAGPLFAHYLCESPDIFDVDVGFPTTTTTTLANQGRVQSSTAPFAPKTAKATYTGPFDDLHQAWSDFGDQLAAAGYVRCTNNWEVYTVGPDMTDDPAQWQTDLFQPIE